MNEYCYQEAKWTTDTHSTGVGRLLEDRSAYLQKLNSPERVEYNKFKITTRKRLLKEYTVRCIQPKEKKEVRVANKQHQLLDTIRAVWESTLKPVYPVDRPLCQFLDRIFTEGRLEWLQLLKSFHESFQKKLTDHVQVR